jgi:hypothetical protein
VSAGDRRGTVGAQASWPQPSTVLLEPDDLPPGPLKPGFAFGLPQTSPFLDLRCQSSLTIPTSCRLLVPDVFDERAPDLRAQASVILDRECDQLLAELHRSLEGEDRLLRLHKMSLCLRR